MCIEREMWFLSIYMYTCMVRSAYLHELSLIEQVFLASIVYCISTIRIFRRLCCINDVEVFLVVERIVDNREYTLIS